MWGTTSNSGVKCYEVIFVFILKWLRILISILCISFSWFWTQVGERNIINRTPNSNHHCLVEKPLNCSYWLSYKILSMAYKVLSNLVQIYFFLGSFLAFLLILSNTTVTSNWSHISEDKCICYFFSAKNDNFIFSVRMGLTLSSRSNVNATILYLKPFSNVTDRIIHSFNFRNNVFSLSMNLPPKVKIMLGRK